MSSYSIYRKVIVTSTGLEVSDDKFALISDNNIQRHEMINTISLGYKSIVVAVSDDKYFVPNDNFTYTLDQGLAALNNINQALNSDNKDDERMQQIRDAIKASNKGYQLGAAFD
jgi:hypothetical protein